MRIVKVEPGKPAEICEIDGSLESMQEIVGGNIEVLYPWVAPVCLVGNEDAKRLKLEPNRVIVFTDRLNNFANHWELIRGAFFIIGLSEEGDFRGLDLEEAEYIYPRFPGRRGGA